MLAQTLTTLLEAEKYEDAFQLIKDADISKYDDTLCILSAEICNRLSLFDSALDYISFGMSINARNPELFFMLGNYYANVNANQAFLCYEMASFYAEGTCDEPFYEDYKQSYCSSNDVTVNPVTFAIVSYNSCSITQACLDSIRRTLPCSSYTISVADNASSDGVLDYLSTQTDILLTANSENTGFAYASNQAAEKGPDNNDVFFLNNDTILPDNSVFWLRMGLYSDECVGAVGPTTNSAGNRQRVQYDYTTPDEWLRLAKSINIPSSNPYESKIWLVGFAMLIKRCVVNEVGLFDLQYGIGNFEDDDLGVRIYKAGYKLLLCHNSFVFHYGSMGFKQRDSQSYDHLLQKNRSIFSQKWKFDIITENYINDEYISKLPSELADASILMVNCGLGSTVNRIKYLYPNAIVLGINTNPILQPFTINNSNIINDTFEHFCTSSDKSSFDYIILNDITAEDFCSDYFIMATQLLSGTGRLIANYLNATHPTYCVSLACGSITTEKLNCKHYTYSSIVDFLHDYHLELEDISGLTCTYDISSDEKALLDYLVEHVNSLFSNTFAIYSYIVVAKINHDYAFPSMNEFSETK